MKRQMAELVDVMAYYLYMAGKFIAPLWLFSVLLFPLYESVTFARFVSAVTYSLGFVFLSVMGWRRLKSRGSL